MDATSGSITTSSAFAFIQPVLIPDSSDIKSVQDYPRVEVASTDYALIGLSFTILAQAISNKNIM